MKKNLILFLVAMLAIIVILAVVSLYLYESSNTIVSSSRFAFYEASTGNMYFGGEGGYSIVNGTNGKLIQTVELNDTSPYGDVYYMNFSSKYAYVDYGVPMMDGEPHYLYLIGIKNNSILKIIYLCGTSCGTQIAYDSQNNYVYLPTDYTKFVTKNWGTYNTTIEYYSISTINANLTSNMDNLSLITANYSSGFFYNNQNKYIYSISNPIQILNGSNNQFIDNITPGGFSSFIKTAFNPADNQLYVPYVDSLYIANLSNNSFINRINFSKNGSLRGLTYDSSNGYLYILWGYTFNSTNEIIVMNATTYNILYNRTSENITSIVYDPKNNKIYAASSNGQLSIINS